MTKGKYIIVPEQGTTGYHIPVLLAETIEMLNIRPDGTYVDCTFGGGGHSKAILEKLNSSGRLIVFDQDENAKQNVPDDPRVIFVPENFRHLKRFLKLHKAEQADGILADLGVSSHQFDEAERGFSIRFEAALDMRMDRRQTRSASDVLNSFTEIQLHKLFEQYGEVTNSKTLARTIIEQRLARPIKTTADLKNAIGSVIKGNPNKYLAQVFQSLRIEVNDEIGALKEMLGQGLVCLKPGGRFAVITFHSLEDRLVKNFFKAGTFDELKDDVYGTKPENPFLIITKKPVTAGEKEQRINKRSRSAKLRVAEKR